MMKKALKVILSSIGLSKNKQSVPVCYNDELNRDVKDARPFQKMGKGRGRKAHKPSGIAKAKRAAKKLRNKRK
ncbi:hypothetical protein RHO14_06915 [Orbus wheelerorum]|uniref:hypothetical protein n=1 Tax=Orbus wheelerorum TaxID=3074111 RepID=UPI00370D6AE3